LLNWAAAVESQVTQEFPTLIASFRVPDAELMNERLQALILAEGFEYSSLGRRHVGGWRSRPDYLTRQDPVMNSCSWGLRRIIDATTSDDGFQGTFSVSGWATFCRTGAYYGPHFHPDSARSGDCYISSGSETFKRPLSCALEFLDAPAGVETVTARGDPCGEPRRVRPQTLYLLVFFPNWRYRTHPYVGEVPRIIWDKRHELLSLATRRGRRLKRRARRQRVGR
jgi:hypothetical protein